MEFPAPSRPMAYFLALAAAIIAIVVRVAIAPALFTNATFIPFFLAVLLAAWYGGFGPGLLATVIGATATNWLLLEPTGSFAVADQDGMIRLSLYVTVAVLISLACESLHRARRRTASMRSDITELRRMEEELRELAAELSEADHRKDRFLATLSHELRNPLAPISNALELIRRADGDQGTIEAARATLERQVAHLVRLVDDLLDVSRITRDKLQLKRQVVPLAAVINAAVEAAEPLVVERKHTLEVEPVPPDIHLDVDPTRAAQVLANLLNNAAKYTDPGGRVRIRTGIEGDKARIAVQDNGIGMQADDVPRALEMFGQVDASLERSDGGLGIGLSLSKRLVEMHGGSISVQAVRDGPGTEVTVLLPIALETATREPDPPLAFAHRLRVLVADDNADSADTMAIMLELMGHETRVASDGEDALEMAAAYQPDLVLLDIGMPRLNGYEACRRIRALPWAGERVRIVAVTGWGQEDDLRRSREAGFDRHMVKPLDAEELQAMLGELFGDR
ncbi:ATP-binding response regulator [Luteimonas vadosa]|uniref:histidine kinase n=1 Tax=Luteimonas vadosa TaxID=1165507 RepID=A0ABP9DW11_9GAMM